MGRALVTDLVLRKNPQAIIDTRSHPRYNSIKQVRFFLPKSFDLFTRNLPDRGPLAGEGAVGVRPVLKESAFADQSARCQGSQMLRGTVQAADDFNLALRYQAGPLTRGGFVKEPFSGCVCFLFTARKKNPANQIRKPPCVWMLFLILHRFCSYFTPFI